MAHFMSNENNDDNDNDEKTVQKSSRERNQKGKKTYLFLVLCLKFLEFEFPQLNKSIFTSKLGISPIISKSCFLSLF